MKKSFTNASPFLMLLVPVFFCFALMLFNAPQPASEEVSGRPALKIPTVQTLVKAIF